MSKKFHSSMADQIKNLGLDKNAYGSKYIPFAGKWEGDGIDHINISHYGQTPLGPVLEPSRVIPFSHPLFGNFKSIEVMIEFLKLATPDDRLRNMTGMEMRNLYREIGNPPRVPLVNMHAIILHSLWCRLVQRPNYLRMFVNSTLPFDQYTELPSGMRVRKDSAPWLCGGLEQLREALQKNQEPDFTFLMDDVNHGLYDAVFKRLVGEIPADGIRLKPVSMAKSFTEAKPAKEPKAPKPVKVAKNLKIQDIDQSSMPIQNETVYPNGRLLQFVSMSLAFTHDDLVEFEREVRFPVRIWNGTKFKDCKHPKLRDKHKNLFEDGVDYQVAEFRLPKAKVRGMNHIVEEISPELIGDWQLVIQAVVRCVQKADDSSSKITVEDFKVAMEFPTEEALKEKLAELMNDPTLKTEPDTSSQLHQAVKGMKVAIKSFYAEQTLNGVVTVEKLDCDRVMDVWHAAEVEFRIKEAVNTPDGVGTAEIQSIDHAPEATDEVAGDVSDEVVVTPDPVPEYPVIEMSTSVPSSASIAEVGEVGTTCNVAEEDGTFPANFGT